MTDSTLNRFISAGSAASRAAFTPSPPTPAAGAAQGYFWHETDTGDTYSWKAGTGWIKVNTGSVSTASTTEQLTGTDSAKATTSDSVAALWEQGADVASAGTTSLGEGGYFNITGTTTITDIDFATDKAGRKAWVKFVGILTLTHNASTLILPTGANITTAAGDTACFVSEGSDVVRCVAYNRASGAALIGGGSGSRTLIQQIAADSATTTFAITGIPNTYKSLEFEFVFSGSGQVSFRINNDNTGTDGTSGKYFDQFSGAAVTTPLDLAQNNKNQIPLFNGSGSFRQARGACLNYNIAMPKILDILSCAGTASNNSLLSQTETILWNDNTVISELDFICATAPTLGYVRVYGVN
jgi:hypothetical protein